MAWWQIILMVWGAINIAFVLFRLAVYFYKTRNDKGTWFTPWGGIH